MKFLILVLSLISFCYARIGPNDMNQKFVKLMMDDIVNKQSVQQESHTIKVLSKQVQEQQEYIEQLEQIIKSYQNQENQDDTSFLETSSKTNTKSDPVLKAMTFGFPASRTNVFYVNPSDPKNNEYTGLKLCPAGCIVQG